jgi:hypothetical protein
MTLKCTPTLGVALVRESRMFKTLVGKANKHQIGPLGHHWKGFEMSMLKVPSHCSFRHDLHELWSKEKGKRQIGNLTPDHKPLESKNQMSSDWSVLYIVGKIFLKVIRYYLWIFKIDFIWERYECPKFWDNNNPNFGTPTWESRGEVTFGCNPHREAQSILEGREWCFFSKVVGCVNFVLEVVPTKSVASFPFNLH